MYTKFILDIRELTYAVNELTASYFTVTDQINSFLISNIMTYVLGLRMMHDTETQESKDEDLAEYIAYCFEEIVGWLTGDEPNKLNTEYADYYDELTLFYEDVTELFPNKLNTEYADYYDELTLFYEDVTELFVVFTNKYDMLWSNFNLTNAVVQQISNGYAFIYRE